MSKTKTLTSRYYFSEPLAMVDYKQHTANSASKAKHKRIESIDLLRGFVMIIMALDHVRDYFSRDAFVFDPADLTKTTPALFFTRFITHYCAPVFIFLAGVSAYLYGSKKTKKELSVFLLTRGIWLVLLELFVVSLFRTFDLSFTYVNLQVIWAIGVCMIFMSAIIYMPGYLILATGIVIVAAHNLLDTVHVSGDSPLAFLWSALHDVRHFYIGHFNVYMHYPVLAWLGVMMLGYFAGRMYTPAFDAAKRKRILLVTGVAAIVLFIVLRSGNLYGDASPWSMQKDAMFGLLSFLNVTKYPPSLLYLLVTLGPALLFLAFAEKPLNAVTQKVTILGRVPMFYYLTHILLIHIAAVILAAITGYPAMYVLTNSVNATPQLHGFGFALPGVYLVWIALVIFLFPFCKWFDAYKRKHQATKWWLSYL